MPLTASTWPADSIGSRTAAPIFSSLILLSSMPIRFATAGHILMARSPSATPSVLPCRSVTLSTPRLRRATIA